MAVLALVALAAYGNTFRVPFLFDDAGSIGDNPTIRHLWRIWRVLAPPNGHGLTVGGRPILNLSLALNYAVSGLHVWSYHALNLLIHILAGLTLFGLVRRTLQVAAGGPVALPAARRWTTRTVRLPGAGALLEADLLAFGAAHLWLLHPLQTEAVTYIIQRTESMMAFFFLLTFYCFVRSLQSPRPRRWRILAVIACLLSVGTKEVSATIPVLLFLFDRTFAAGSLAEAWRRRRGFHLAIAATWLPLLGLVASTGWDRGGTAGFNVGVAPWAYWFTQFEAVARYLRQMAWPHPLILDYGTFTMTAAQAAPYALLVIPVALVTLAALWRRPVPSFLGGWFFAILAPTSLVPGTIQMIVEHRLYLPLAAVVVLVVGTAAVWCGARATLVLCLALAVPEGWLTFQRNHAYRSDLSLWRNTVEHSPGSLIAQGGLADALYARGDWREALFHYDLACRLNPKRASAHYNIGLTLLKLHRLDHALAQFAEAVRLDPGYAAAEYETALALLLAGRPQEALPHFQRTIELAPRMAEAQYEWGVALARLGQPADAIPHYRAALQFGSGHADVETDLGVALYQVDRLPEAVACFRRALQVKPDQVDAHYNLGLALARMDRNDEALVQYADAARLAPDRAKIQFNFGLALARAGRLAEAVIHFREAARLAPDRSDIQLNLGIALAQTGNTAMALDHLEAAVRLAPRLAEARCNLGIVLAQSGCLTEAVAQYEAALRLRPDYASAHYNYGVTLLRLGREPEARRQFEAALRIAPQFAPAREMLERLPNATPGP